MRSTLDSVTNAGLATADYIVQLKKRLLIAAGILAGSIPLMWLINIAGFRELNFIGFFLGGAAILVVAFRPEALLAAMGIGAVAGWLGNRNTSQGVLRGVQALHKLTVGALFAFWGAAGLLAVHPWQQSPGAFWAILASILVVVSVFQLYDIKATALRVTVVVGYTAVVCVYALWSTVPATWQGRMFDARTGLPLAMMEPDGSRVYHDRRPADCVNGCFSEFTGKRLVPVTPEVAARNGVLVSPVRAPEADDALSVTGKVIPSRTYGDMKVFAFGADYRRVDIPPGNRLCADPIDKVEWLDDSSLAVQYLRSSTGRVEHVFLYYVPYRGSCVLK